MLNARVLLTALLACLALAVAACGGDDAEESAATTAETSEQAAAPADPKQLAEQVTDDAEEKPSIPPGQGEPPSELVSVDITEGDGRAAKVGDNVTVQYVGVNWSNGAEFDASWDRGEPFEFTLGSGNVIAGWDEGVEGMKVGGRRELVIPPALGYGAAGAPPAIPPNETLVFVVDLEAVN